MKAKKILVDDRYLIYTDLWVVYDTTKAKPIPQYIFKLIEKLRNG